jgi:uncharacterized damage-inducible protein DinB
METATQPIATSSIQRAQPGGAPSASELMHSLMRYKAWADADLLRAAIALPALGTAPEGGYVTAIIRHFHTVDCIFRAHLLGIPHPYTSPNPPEPATLSELQPRVAEIDAWYVEYVRNLEERALGEVLCVTYTDGEQQLLTRSDILVHVSQHGGGHRAQVGLLFRMLGADPPPDRFTNYIRLRIPNEAAEFR